MRGNHIVGVDRSISLNHDGSFGSGHRCLRRDCKDFDLRFGPWLSVAAQRRAVRAARPPGFPTGVHILELRNRTHSFYRQIGHLSRFFIGNKRVTIHRQQRVTIHRQQRDDNSLTSV
jgi:hypothetical protein